MPTLHLHSFLLALLRQKPRDWSVVRRGNEIQIRPPDRAIGKFVVRRDSRRADGVSIGHYDRQQDRWLTWADRPAEPAAVYAYLAECVGSIRGTGNLPVVDVLGDDRSCPTDEARAPRSAG